MTRPPNQRRSTSKKLFLAAMLQCVPLLGAAGCFASSANNQSQSSLSAALLLWASVLFWGLGYLYVGAFTRFVVAALAGPVLAIAACSASFSGVNFDYEHSNGNATGHDYPHDVPAANRASIQTGLLVSLAVMVLAVDAARLAAARNARGRV